MKKINRIAYEALDGKVFDNEKDCLAHEKKKDHSLILQSFEKQVTKKSKKYLLFLLELKKKVCEKQKNIFSFKDERCFVKYEISSDKYATFTFYPYFDDMYYLKTEIGFEIKFIGKDAFSELLKANIFSLETEFFDDELKDICSVFKILFKTNELSNIFRKISSKDIFSEIEEDLDDPDVRFNSIAEVFFRNTEQDDKAMKILFETLQKGLKKK
jgi:hypothetical protein